MAEIIPIDTARTGPTTGETAPQRPAPPPFRRVYVLFTDVEGTLSAVKVASRFAPAIGGRLTVVHFRPIDFGAPLDTPAGISPAETAAFRERLSAEGCDVDVTVCVCRDARRALPSIIDVHSLVVVGGEHHWWPTRSDRWRRRLEQAGYVVVLVGDGFETGQIDE